MFCTCVIHVYCVLLFIFFKTNNSLGELVGLLQNNTLTFSVSFAQLYLNYKYDMIYLQHRKFAIALDTDVIDTDAASLPKMNMSWTSTNLCQN